MGVIYGFFSLKCILLSFMTIIILQAYKSLTIPRGPFGSRAMSLTCFLEFMKENYASYGMLWRGTVLLILMKIKSIYQSISLSIPPYLAISLHIYPNSCVSAYTNGRVSVKNANVEITLPQKWKFLFQCYRGQCHKCIRDATWSLFR